MSYLDLPRLHFAGLFYTGPSTINNTTENYMLSTELENPPGSGQYDPNVVGWNANGVAQWYLQQCTVLSGVGPDGTVVTSNTADGVIGVAVQSPSPTTPMSDGGGGAYDLAKMVDLDPDQQGRSAVYGMRIGVALANGAGFQGLITVPELRQLNGRVAGIRSSYAAVGNWMGTLQNVVWTGDVSSSPLLTALEAAGTEGLAVKLTVDLHQNNPATIFSAGNMFCFGRVMGSIGPALPGELPQVIPGRCIQTYTPPTHALAAAEAVAPTSEGRLLQGRDLVTAKTAAMAPLSAAAAAAKPKPWNPAFCLIRPTTSGGLLSVDIGGCTLLQASNGVSDGTFTVNDGIEVGLLDPATQNFTAFTNGALSVTGHYTQLTSTSKNCVLVDNSGVFTFALTGTEMTSAAATPLAIAINGTVVAAEFSNGYWMDVAVASQRLQCGGGNGTTQIMVRQWGNPVAGVAPPVTSTIQLLEWVEQDGQWGNPNPLPDSTDLGITLGTTDANGIADVTVTVNTASNNLPAIRQPLDSYVYYISLTDPDNNPIGDGQSNATISVVLWNPYSAPANPTWADAGAVLSAYGRLYPGMQARLDISDQQTVTGFAPAILARMSLPVLDPAFMPVTRDLSPTKTSMVLAYLGGLAKAKTASA